MPADFREKPPGMTLPSCSKVLGAKCTKYRSAIFNLMFQYSYHHCLVLLLYVAVVLSFNQDCQQ